MAKILETLCTNYWQYMNLSALFVIQTNQVGGLGYGRVKKLKWFRLYQQGYVS